MHEWSRDRLISFAAWIKSHDIVGKRGLYGSILQDELAYAVVWEYSKFCIQRTTVSENPPTTIALHDAIRIHSKFSQAL